MKQPKNICLYSFDGRYKITQLDDKKEVARNLNEGQAKILMQSPERPDKVLLFVADRDSNHWLLQYGPDVYTVRPEFASSIDAMMKCKFPLRLSGGKLILPEGDVVTMLRAVDLQKTVFRFGNKYHVFREGILTGISNAEAEGLLGGHDNGIWNIGENGKSPDALPESCPAALCFHPIISMSAIEFLNALADLKRKELVSNNVSKN